MTHEIINRHEPIRFFKGPEIEKTKFYMKPMVLTSGVYDYQECKDVLVKEDCKHILLGGFMYESGTTIPGTLDVPRAFDLINKLIADGYGVTLEIRSDQLTDEVIALCPEPNTPEADLFVLMVSSYMPNLDKIGSYTTLKLHSDWESSNGGVICLDAETFRREGHLTGWREYDQDIKLK